MSAHHVWRWLPIARLWEAREFPSLDSALKYVSDPAFPRRRADCCIVNSDNRCVWNRGTECDQQWRHSLASARRISTPVVVAPVEDTALVVEAERLATGARIHDVMGWIGIYRNAIQSCARAASRLNSGNGYQADRHGFSDADQFPVTAETVQRYETKLRAFVAAQRQASVLEASP